MDPTESHIRATRPYGVRSSSAPLWRVLVRRPTTKGDFRSAGWREPDVAHLLGEHDRFCELLSELGCDVTVADPIDGLVDACYVHDPVIMTAGGAIQLRMVKAIRRTEPQVLADELRRLGVAVPARLDGTAYCDGGDTLWLDQETLLVGRGYRTNAEAVTQLRELLKKESVAVEAVDLPHDRGPEHVLHLQSIVSLVGSDLAVVFEPLAPVSLLERLMDRGIRWVSVDPDEYRTLGCNVLAVRPGVVIMIDGNKRTRTALEAAGSEVHVYQGAEISLKGDGGPTCLTRPIWRADLEKSSGGSIAV